MRDFRGLPFASVLNDDGTLNSTLVRDSLASLDYYLRDSSRGFRRIENGQVPSGSGTLGGVTDHGDLTGLADDDHLQYLLLAGRGALQTVTGGLTVVGGVIGNSFTVTAGNTSTVFDSTGLRQTNALSAATLNLVGDSYINLQCGTAPTLVAINSDGSEPSMDVRNGFAGTVALKVRQAASQTADLLQFTASTGTGTLTSVDKDGLITAPKFTATGVPGFYGNARFIDDTVNPALLIDSDEAGGNYAGTGLVLFGATSGFHGQLVVPNLLAQDTLYILPAGSAITRIIGTTETVTITAKTLGANSKIRCGSSAGDTNAVGFMRSTSTTVGIRLDLTDITSSIKELKVQNEPGTVPILVAPTSATTDKTGQTASIGATTAYTTVAAGLFRICAYVVFTAVTTPGAITVTGLWTDPKQAQTRALPTINAAAYAAAGDFFEGSQVIRCTAGSTIQYSTTLTGAGTYNVYVRVEALS